MKFYDVRISLLEVTPSVWRQLLMPEDLNLFQMHRVFQAAMGWSESHLHRFFIEDQAYSLPEFQLGHEVSDERLVRLSALAKIGTNSFLYEYDFGDSWQHEIEIGQYQNAQLRRPFCIEGSGRCPPEDCGGASIYSEMLRSFRLVNHPDHKTTVRILGKKFNPAEFDLEAADRSLSRLRLRTARRADTSE